MHDLFVEHLLVVITTGTVASVICRQFSWPTLLGYLVTGIIIGDSGFGFVPGQVDEITHLAELGVFFLLFSIGLELSLEELRKLGRFLLLGGAIQMGLVALPTVLIMSRSQFSAEVCWLTGIAVAFSSTVLVFKSLGEIGKTEQPEGRRTLSILLFQDAALVPLLLVIPLITQAQSSDVSLSWQVAQMTLISGAFIAAILILRKVLSRWMIPRIARYRSPDLVLLLTLAVLGSVCLIAYRVGLPAAIGAFSAGLLFSDNRWSQQVDSLIFPFREVFAALFFVSLGLLIDITVFWEHPQLIAMLVVGLIILKYFAASVSLLSTGLSIRSSFRTALSLAHVGEFSYVVVLLGLTTEVYTSEEQRILFGVFGATLLTAPLMIRWGFSGEGTSEESIVETAAHARPLESAPRTCAVIGMGPVGISVARRLETLGFDVLVMDRNPLNFQALTQTGFRGIAGDALEKQVLINAGIDHTTLIVICLPDDEIAAQVTQACRELNPAACIVVRCRYTNQQSALRRAGADQVLSEESILTQELIGTLETSLPAYSPVES